MILYVEVWTCSFLSSKKILHSRLSTDGGIVWLYEVGDALPKKTYLIELLLRLTLDLASTKAAAEFENPKLEIHVCYCT